jgi:DNA-binding response OmpR family regulator
VTRALRQSGAEVVGPVATIADAERAIGSAHFDCAVLDMNLRGEMSFPLADRLQAAGIPFLIATGYNSGSLPERFSNHPRIEKPFEPEQLAAAIPALLS